MTYILEKAFLNLPLTGLERLEGEGSIGTLGTSQLNLSVLS